MSRLKEILFAIVFAIAAFSVIFVMGFNAGSQSANTKQAAKQAIAAQQARDAYDAKQRQGEQAAAAYLAAERERTTQFQTLTEKFNVLRRNTPLVTPRAGLVVCNSGGTVRTQPDTSSPEQPLAQPHRQPTQEPADDTGIALTAGTVWMWNSALTGVDQPTHSCGAADPAAPACAAGTSLSLDSAWDNHIANAEICAANRLAHQSLIDFIHQQQKSAP